MGKPTTSEAVKTSGDCGGRPVRGEPAIDVSVSNFVSACLVAFHTKINRQILHSSSGRNVFQPSAVQFGKTARPMQRVDPRLVSGRGWCWQIADGVPNRC